MRLFNSRLIECFLRSNSSRSLLVPCNWISESSIDPWKRSRSQKGQQGCPGLSFSRLLSLSSSLSRCSICLCSFVCSSYLWAAELEQVLLWAVGESKMLMVFCLVWQLLFCFRLWKAHFITCFLSEGLSRKPRLIWGNWEWYQYQTIYPTKKKEEEKMVKWSEQCWLVCKNFKGWIRYVV